MAERRPPHTPPSGPDGDGVRVVDKPRAARRGRAWMVAVAVAGGTVALGAWFVLGRSPGQGSAPSDTHGLVVEDKTSPSNAPAPRSAAPGNNATAQEPEPMPGNDPDDLASYFQPGDPEPTGAQVITALQDAGVRTGLGAFNPPGTSPPLEGLAVPEDFRLPDGYVRHHQVTDEGVPIEPILMFSPEFTLYDKHGKPIAMPENRVVPPELAPPDMPLRRVRIPKP